MHAEDFEEAQRLKDQRDNLGGHMTYAICSKGLPFEQIAKPKAPPSFLESLLATEEETQTVANGYVGEIVLVASKEIPGGWIPCEGQELQISLYTPLFSILGTNFGGDGRSTFAVPNLTESQNDMCRMAETDSGIAYFILGNGTFPSRPTEEKR